MKINVRNYQNELIDGTRSLMAAKHRRVILQSPCGSGKTRMSAKIVESSVEKKKTVLFLVAGRTLVTQAHKSYTDLGINAAILMRDYEYKKDAPVQVASIHTVFSRLAYLDWLEPDLLITDEAHETVGNSPNSMWAAIRKRWPDAYEVGLTATPKPTEVFSAMVPGPEYEWLIEQGYLVRPRYYSVKESDSELLKIGNSDFSETSQARAFERITLIGGVVKHWQSFAQGRATVLFSPTVATSIKNAELFNEAGISAFHIDTDTPHEVRQACFDALADGSLKVICNYGVLSRGFDCPAVSCVIFERETRSLTAWIQAVSRALRPHPAKQDAIIIDLGENIHRPGFNFVDDPPVWTLDGKTKEQTESDSDSEAKAPKDVTCRECRLVYKAAPKCPGCGFEPQQKAKEGEIGDRREAELTEVKPKARKPVQPDPGKFYAMLRYAEQWRNLGKISADHLYKEKFGSWPDASLKDHPPVYPSLTVSRYVRSRQIAYNARSHGRN